MPRTLTRPDQVKFVNLDKPDLRGRVAPATDAIVAAACRLNPGQFAELPLAGRKPTSIQINVNQQGTKAFPKGQFRVRLVKGTAYVAYVGKS